MALVVNFLKFIGIVFLLNTVSFAENNASRVDTKDQRDLLLSMQEKVKQSYLKLENILKKCKEKRNHNIITDFQFSNPIFTNVDIGKWIHYYDMLNTDACIQSVNNELVADIFIFNKFKQEYRINDIGLTESIFPGIDILMMSMENKYVHGKAYEKDVPLEVRKYLDSKLNHLFNSRALRKAYKSFMEKKK